MSKIFLVCKREYLSRVTKKSFIVMTLLAPILLAAFYGALIWLMMSENSDKTVKIVEVADYSGVFTNGIPANGVFEYRVNGAPGDRKSLKANEESYGLLVVPEEFSMNSSKGITFISSSTLSLANQQSIQKSLENEVERMKFQQAGIRKTMIDSLKTNINIESKKATGDEIKDNNSAVNAGVGFAGAFLIYIFIFLYGVQVMRGVQEEKTNRIVEVIVSSVKPFQLMMGKIIGIAMVGLTQILIWIVFTAILGSVVTAMVGPELLSRENTEVVTQNGPAIAQAAKEAPGGNLLMAVFNLNFPLILGMFVFYFISGYLLYSALFAAIAAAVDSETDTQQFMFPITIPLIFAIIVAQAAVLKDPHGPMAFWFSIIPFTSPIVMMVRIPFEVPAWELLLSMALMVIGFVGTTWMAAKIYRIGILMYGKKATYKELFKWLTYKN